MTDSAFACFVLGETYTVTIDGVTADYVARNFSPLSDEFGPIIGTVTTFNMEDRTFDGWACVVDRNPDGKADCIAETLDTSFVGKAISISQTKTETVKRYNTKLLPEYLLPAFLRKNVVATKAEVQRAADKATAAEDTALGAQSAANAAYVNANGAQSTANTAKSTAEAAQSTANTAKSTADEAKTKAINAYTKASIAETTAQNAVSFTTTQSLTDTEKKTARDNIGASSFSGVQPDWNQNDSTAADYVKNRPFYTGNPVETVLVEESTVSFAAANGMYMGQLESTFSATVGETYKVYWDGVAYECAGVKFKNATVIGNLSIMGGSDTGEPFVIGPGDSGIQIITVDAAASHTFSISGISAVVVKIDAKYLPDTIAIKSDVEAAQSTADTAQNTANAAQNTANAAQNTANAAQNTANAAQNTANTALERAIDPYTRNEQMAPLYKNGGFSAWRDVVQQVLYNSTEGYFFVNMFDTTALKKADMPNSVFCVDLYVENRNAKAFLSSFSTGSDYWGVKGFAIITDEGSRTGEVLYVSSNTISPYSGKGLFLTFRAPNSMLLKSSTANSTKQFRITVDDSGTISATEVT